MAYSNILMKKLNNKQTASFLLELFDASYSGKAWHGPTLHGSLRGIGKEEAAWRPAPERHNIWEIAVHCAYWKFIARKRLLGDKRGSFPLKGSNWFRKPTVVTDEAWEEDLLLLHTSHKALREAVVELNPAEFDSRTKGGKESNVILISGIASHDVYHAGQIQLLKRLQQG
ncbi:MAG: DinB family protein [Bacteroidetes bacterium]|nr:MAG: DinB family protein [Bacteroidota bacterium]